MSRAYLFAQGGEQIDQADWFCDLRALVDYPRAIIAIRGRKGYRMCVADVPAGWIGGAISRGDLTWSNFAPHPDRMILPTIAAVRAYLALVQ